MKVHHNDAYEPDSASSGSSDAAATAEDRGVTLKSVVAKGDMVRLDIWSFFKKKKYP